MVSNNGNDLIFLEMAAHRRDAPLPAIKGVCKSGESSVK